MLPFVPRLRPLMSSTRRHFRLLPEHFTQGSAVIDPCADDGFDIQIPDINFKVLLDDVSVKLGYPYLSRALAAKETAACFGITNLGLCTFCATLGPRLPICLTKFIEACDALFGNELVPPTFTVALGGRLALVRPSPALSHFKHLNLLGADFCTLYGVRAVFNYRSKKTSLVFNYWGLE